VDSKKNIFLQTQWRLFIEGNSQCLGHVYSEYFNYLLFTAVFILKSEEKAKDVVSDIFKKLLELNADQRNELLGEVEDKLGTFLKVMVKNKCLDLIKIEKNRKNIITSIQGLFNRSDSNEFFLEESFHKMLDTLPNQQRIILELHLKGFDTNEIAQKLDISYNTCRNTLSTSKKKIRLLWSTFMS
jgi:RNA polymerase sigma factor (sigma-70 family)